MGNKRNTALSLLIEGARVAGPAGSRNWNHRHWQNKVIEWLAERNLLPPHPDDDRMREEVRDDSIYR